MGEYYSFGITDRTFIQFHPEGWYFRIFGYGLSVRPRDNAPCFSERMGLKRDTWRIWKWNIEALSPRPRKRKRGVE